MRKIGETRALVNKYFPRMTDEQVATATPEENAVYALARLLDSALETTKFGLDMLHRRLSALEQAAGVTPQVATAAPARATASGINVNAAEAPTDLHAAAEWVMGGIPNDSPGGGGEYDPFAAGAQPAAAPAAGGGTPPVAPSSGQPSLPPEIVHEMTRPPQPPPEAPTPTTPASAKKGG